MKYIFFLLLIVHFSTSYGQLKKKQRGWYSGSIPSFYLFQPSLQNQTNVDSLNVEPTSICINIISEENFELLTDDKLIPGKIESHQVTKKETKLTLRTTEFGSFEAILDERKKIIFFNQKNNQPIFEMKKLPRKETCSLANKK